MQSEYEFLSPANAMLTHVCRALVWWRISLVLGLLLLPTRLHAATILGTIKDPSGAVIPPGAE